MSRVSLCHISCSYGVECNVSLKGLAAPATQVHDLATGKTSLSSAVTAHRNECPLAQLVCFRAPQWDTELVPNKLYAH